MIQRLSILGATGDLAARYLRPGLAVLRAAGGVCTAPVMSMLRTLADRGRRRDWSPERAYSVNGIFISVTRRGVSNMWGLSARTPQRPQFVRERDHQRAYGENERPDHQDDRKRARRRERQQQ